MYRSLVILQRDKLPALFKMKSAGFFMPEFKFEEVKTYEQKLVYFA